MAAHALPELSIQTPGEDSVMPLRMSLEEYLNTAFHPDREFVDGWVVDKDGEGSLGTKGHGYLQAELAYWFRLHRGEWGVRVGNEVRTLITESRVRLPDVMVVREERDLKESVQSTPPYIAIEILSPGDRFNRVIPRLEDFARIGTEHIWLLDPEARVAYVYDDGSLRLVQSTKLTVPDSPIHLDLPELFAAALD